jgi:hypothetical protein
MSEFMKSSPRIDALVNSATSFESLREQVRLELERTGVVALDPNDPYNAKLIRKPEMDAPAVVVAEPVNQGPTTHFRVIYPFQNDRYELTGHSEAELDQKEAAIRSALGARGRS